MTKKISLLQHIKSWDAYYVAALGLFVVFAVVRAWHLASPQDVIFDEVYFPVFAQKYIIGEAFFDIHPPLGKWIIAVGEWVFGNNAFGWRIMSYLFGMGLLTVLWQLAWRMTKSWQAAFIALLIAGVDGMLFVYGRLGLMDGIMYFFVFAAFLFFVIALEQKIVKKQVLYLLLAAVLTGCAVAIKWLGLAALILCFVWLLFHWKKLIVPYPIIGLFVLLLVASGTYVLAFLGEGGNWQQLSRDIMEPFDSVWNAFVTWHKQAYVFSRDLTATHPYGSSWWTWPFMVRPIWDHFQLVDGHYYGIITIGNPLTWWSALVVFVYTVFFVWPKNAWQWCLSISSVLMYVPWIFISRVSFLYYFMGVAIVWQLLLSLTLWQLWKSKQGKIIVPILLGLFALWFVCFYPLLTGIPISQKYFNALLWFEQWRS